MNKQKLKSVLIFRNTLLPASETFIKSQAMSLREHEPYFVGSQRTGGIELPPQKVVVINNGHGFTSLLAEKIFKFTLHPPNSLILQLKRLSPALMHAHFALDGVFALPIANALDIPLLVTLHGIDVTQDDAFWENSRHYTCRQYLKRRERLIESPRTFFIAVSEFIKSRAIEKGFPENRIKVHYIGVDTERFKPNNDIPKGPVVLFVGRLVEKKGCIYLIHAMKKVQQVIPEAQLVVIGDGPMRSELEAESIRLLRNCTFMGMQDNSIVMEQMSQSRLLAVPSVTSTTGDAEGLPIVIYEAMAMGMPVVSTYSAGIPEAVIHEKTGLLSLERDIESLAGNITSLLSDDLMWQQMSLNSRSICEQKYSIYRQTRELENYYEELIGGIND